MSFQGFSYTLPQILMLKLLSSFAFPRSRTIHNLIFLSTVGSLSENRPALFNRFFKSRRGVYSYEVDRVLRDLKARGYVKDDTALTEQGRELHNRIGFLLRNDYFTDRCLALARGYRGNLWRIDHEILFHPVYRRARPGRKVELKARGL